MEDEDDQQSSAEERFLDSGRAAIHEAGHAASLLADGLTIERCYIRPDRGQYMGYTNGTFYVQFAHEKLRYFAAGFSAERLIDPELQDWPAHASGDKAAFENVIKDLERAGWSGDQLAHARAKALEDARNLVVQQQAAIHRLRKHLEAHQGRPRSTDLEAAAKVVVDELKAAWQGPVPVERDAPGEGAPLPSPPAGN